MTVARRGGRPRSLITVKIVKIDSRDHEWVQEVALATKRSFHSVIGEAIAIARAAQEDNTINLPHENP